MRFASLASSSKANCYIVEHGGAALVIDAGLKKRDMLARLREAGFEPDQLIAILISHHHSDHAKYAGDLSVALHIPVYCSADTLEQAPQSLMAKAEKVMTFQPGDALFVGEAFEVQPVTTYHTPGAVGFRISAGGRNVSVFTDVAELAGGVAEALEQSHLAAIEADYSSSMLEGCDYDPELKRRIRLAHTSNERLAELFSNGFKGDVLRTVVLTHLSVRANAGFIAEQTVGAALRKWCTFSATPPGRGCRLEVAPAEGVLGPIEV